MIAVLFIITLLIALIFTVAGTFINSAKHVGVGATIIGIVVLASYLVRVI